MIAAKQIKCPSNITDRPKDQVNYKQGASLLKITSYIDLYWKIKLVIISNIIFNAWRFTHILQVKYLIW